MTLVLLRFSGVHRGSFKVLEGVCPCFLVLSPRFILWSFGVLSFLKVLLFIGVEGSSEFFFSVCHSF